MKWKPFTSGKPYTCKDCPAYIELLADRDLLQSLVTLFDELYVCPECEKYAATYMMGCQNPLHKIHLEAWDSESKVVRGE